MLTAESLRAARWFGGKNRSIVDTRVIDSARLAYSERITLVEVRYASGPPETYVLAEELNNPDVARGMLSHFRGDMLATDGGGRLEFRPTHVFHGIPPNALEPIRLMSGEQSNTTVRFGDALILKLFRRLQFGPNPDVEIGVFLTEHTTFRGTPPVAGSLSYIGPDGGEASLAMLQRFERNRGDAWTTTLSRVAPVLDGADATESLQAVGRLGATTAELHLALASGTADPAFAPELLSAEDIQVWSTSLCKEIQTVVDALTERGISVDAAHLRERANGIRVLEGAPKTRHHGDYHLGQVLERDDGSFAIIDFEGEPSRPLVQRREKRPPLRDVAGLLRSLDYARTAALRAGGPSELDRVTRASSWYAAARAAFLGAYVRVAGHLLPAEVEPALDALELEKAAYEVMYELNNRPDWLPIPLAALTADS